MQIKKTIILIFLFGQALCVFSQEKIETLSIAWPGSQDWRTIQDKDDSLQHIQIVIPGNESTADATIIGVVKVMKGMLSQNTSDLIEYYQKSLGDGTAMTIIDKKDGKHRWILFKVETPASKKYPIAESDLYYVLQGDYGIYETHIAIKTAKMEPEFQKKWVKIFMAAKLELN